MAGGVAGSHRWSVSGTPRAASLHARKRQFAHSQEELVQIELREGGNFSREFFTEPKAVVMQINRQG